MARYLISQKKIKFDETEEQNYYQCTKCNFKSNSKIVLSNHKESKHGGFCYICDACIFNCNNLRKFLEHKKKVHGRKQDVKMVMKYPIPPKPVLSLKAEEIKAWFPSFFSKISFEIKARREAGQPNPAWIKDIEDVISLSSLKMLASNWG